jgi:large subunit ribosomal protein L10
MPRPEKVQAVANIKERIEGAQAVFLAEYTGLSVKDQQELRRSLRENGAEFKVVKMSMARLAAAELDIDALDKLLLGQTGLAFADGDPAGAAKALKDFARSHDTFAVKGGLLGLEFLPPEKIAELADLEPRDVLMAKIAGVMQAPMANLAGLLAALPRNTANVLQQLLEAKEAEAPSAGAVVAEAVAEEAPAEEPEAADEASEAGASEEATDVADEDAEADDAPEAEASDDAGDESEEPKAESVEEAPEAAEASAGSDTDADASVDDDDESDAASADAEEAVADATDDEDQASDDDATEE